MIEVLIAEDSQVVREYLQYLLEEDGVASKVLRFRR